MTYFDQVGIAVYDGARKLPAASVKRGLLEMGLLFPLHIMAAKPQRAKKIPEGLCGQKYFWHLHEGLIYILWHGSRKSDNDFSMPGWLCGEPQFCSGPGEFIHRLQNAILSFRRAELKAIIRHQPLSLSFTAELDTRRLALGRIQEALAAKSTFEDAIWKNAVEVWLEIILLRHQKHLNTLHRKMDEFLSLMTCDQDHDHGVANSFNRIQRELHHTYSLVEMRQKFPALIDALMKEFPFSASISVEALSPISRQALRWIDEHYHKLVSVADCANSIPVSAAYLCRLLHRETGLSPVQHLQQKRIARAKVLLQESRLSIDEIARRSGFGSLEHFYRVFRKHTNLAPAAYRRNVRNL